MSQRRTRRITRGDILRDNVYSLLNVLILCVMAWQYLRITGDWGERAVTVTATTIAIENSSRGPEALIQWQASGATYVRRTEFGPMEVGQQMDVHYLPEEPERALPFLEVDREPQRVIGTPAVVAFCLNGLLKIWLIKWGPRRRGDDDVVAEVPDRS